MPGELILQQFREQVDTRLSELLSPADLMPTELHEAMRYSALAPGKRLRPVMTMVAAEAVGSNPSIALDAGCATELVHCFSLIHDDLPAIDNDDLRRGRPTCHKVNGEAMEILEVDALLALAFDVVSQCHIDANKVVACVRSLAHSTGSHGLVGGEVLDILSEGVEGDMVLLQTIHARKTGALLGACCEIGGILGGADAHSRGVLREFGNKVGLAFQVADDVLNETSTAEQLGKAVGSDSELNKLTYPRLIGLEESKSLAQQISDEAVALLEPFGERAHHLRGLAEYAVNRDW